MGKTLRKMVEVLVSSKGKELSILIIRLCAGGLMLIHGIQKIMNYGALSETFADPIGIGTEASLILIMLTETVGAALIILGLFTRPAAFALMIGMSVAAFVAHAPFTISGSELALLYLAIFTGLFVSGGGRFSADNYIERYIRASKK